MSKGRVCLAYSGKYFSSTVFNAYRPFQLALFAFACLEHSLTDLTHRWSRYLDNPEMADRYVDS
jgi:hypothetical protein